MGGSQSIAIWFFKVFWLLVNRDARIHWSLAVKYTARVFYKVSYIVMKVSIYTIYLVGRGYLH